MAENRYNVDDILREVKEKRAREERAAQTGKRPPATPEEILAVRRRNDETAEELAATIAEKFPKIKHVVMTGGEPCLFDLAPLCDLLEKQGRTVQIETSGTEPIGNVSKTVWVTVSPKINQAGGRKVLPEALARANEIKMAVATQKEIDQLRSCLSHAPEALIYLQPISQGVEATKLCVEAAMANDWRVSVQVHKYLAVR